MRIPAILTVALALLFCLSPGAATTYVPSADGPGIFPTVQRAINAAADKAIIELPPRPREITPATASGRQLRSDSARTLEQPPLRRLMGAPGARTQDCNSNGIPDECDIDCGQPGGPCDVPGCGLSQDCQSNGFPDECDIDAGTSDDCNTNGIPDECEPDCNTNGFPDDCDIDAGTSSDCNENSIPDECDLTATIVDLGTVPGYPQYDLVFAHSLNDSGRVVGNARECLIGPPANPCEGRAVFWDNGVMTSLPLLPGSAAAYAINESDQVVGTNWFEVWEEIAPGVWAWRTVWSAVRWEQIEAEWQRVALGSGLLRDINSAGQAVGESDPEGADSPQAVLWLPVPGCGFSTAGMHILDNTLGGYHSRAFAMNDSCQVVGWADTDSGAEHTFLWENGVMSDLDPDATFSVAYDINSSGQLVGESDGHACIWIWDAQVAEWEKTDLSSLGWVHSSARAINNFGQIVGAAATITGDRAFLITPEDGVWYRDEDSDGVNDLMANLNDLLPPGSGWSLLEAMDMNDTGQIAGYGGHGGSQRRAFLLTLRSSSDCNGNGIPDECEVLCNDCNGNSVPDECDIAAGTSEDDFPGNGIPDECDWADCNSNGVWDWWDIEQGTSDDCQPNGIPDECDIEAGPEGDCDSRDCNTNSIPDECDIAAGTSDDCQPNRIPDDCDIADCPPGDPDCDDCNSNGIPDECDIADCPPGDPDCDDCNANDIPDECDIADCPPGDPDCDDCNTNDIPDECDIADCPPGDPDCDDCNTNDIPDECDIAAGTSNDCQPNDIPDECEVPPIGPAENDCNSTGIPDECELLCNDCNGNSIPDECDIAAGTSQDNHPTDNGIPDECDRGDCNSNEFWDWWDIANCPPGEVWCQDCNSNGIPDECDIESGPAGDCNTLDGNTDGVPDECQGLLQAHSVRTHGVAGVCALLVHEAGGSPCNIEPRLGGPGELRATFEIEMDSGSCTDPANVCIVGANSGLYTGPINLSLDETGKVVIIEPGEALPDVDCYTVDLTGMTSQWGGHPLDRTFMFAILVGDATCDGMVSTADCSDIKGRLGLPVTEDLCRYDINHDGGISTADKSSVKQRLGNMAPSCP